MGAKALQLTPAAIDAVAERMMELEEGSARLQDENLMLTLKFSTRLKEMEERFKLRLSMLEQRMLTAEKHKDQIANYTMGLPTHEEFEKLKQRVYDLEGRVPV